MTGHPLAPRRSHSSDITKLPTHSQWLTAIDRRGSGDVSRQDLHPKLPGQAGQTGAQTRKRGLCPGARCLLLIPSQTIPPLPHQILLSPFCTSAPFLFLSPTNRPDSVRCTYAPQLYTTTGFFVDSFVYH